MNLWSHLKSDYRKSRTLQNEGTFIFTRIFLKKENLKSKSQKDLLPAIRSLIRYFKLIVQWIKILMALYILFKYVSFSIKVLSIRLLIFFIFNGLYITLCSIFALLFFLSLLNLINNFLVIILISNIYLRILFLPAPNFLLNSHVII